MPSNSRRIVVLVLALGAAFWSAAAMALASRTFVASFGSDANACSLPLPCRSFSSAALQTGDAGEIVVLDSAGYGPVTLTKSVTIVAPSGVYAGITAIPPNPTVGVTVDGAGIHVALRGLSINTYGSGVLFLQGAALTVERCEITAGAVVGAFTYVGGGITADSVPPTLGVPATLFVRDTNILATGGGIFVKGNVVAIADGLRIEGWGFHGIAVLEGARLSLAHAHIAGMQQAVWLESHLLAPVTAAEIVSTTVVASGEGARVTAWTGSVLALTLRDSFVSGGSFGVNALAGSGRVDVSISNSGFRNGIFSAVDGSAGAGGTLRMELDGTEISGASGSVRVAALSGGNAALSLTRSKIVNNEYGVQVVADTGGTGIAAATVSDSLIADNATYGVGCSFAGASVVLSGSTVTRNQSGISVSSGCIGKTRKNNTVDGNAMGDVFGTWTDLPAF